MSDEGEFQPDYSEELVSTGVEDDFFTESEFGEDRVGGSANCRVEPPGIEDSDTTSHPATRREELTEAEGEPGGESVGGSVRCRLELPGELEPEEENSVIQVTVSNTEGERRWIRITPKRKREEPVECRRMRIQEVPDAGPVAGPSCTLSRLDTPSIKPVVGPTKDPKTRGCQLCHATIPRRYLRRHLSQVHLPWYISPGRCCWTCEVVEDTVSYVRNRHANHGVHPMFDDHNLNRWLGLVQGLLGFLR